MTKIAIITGGTSGIGLEVARALAERPAWKIYLLAISETPDRNTAQEVRNSVFIKVDVSEYESLSIAFDTIFTQHGRLDFVFANAGVSGSQNFFDSCPLGGIPPKLDLQAVEVNVNGVIYTSYLALQYFRRSPPISQRSLVITASSAAFYPVRNSIYTATKHAVLGFMRSIAPRCKEEGIHVNAICPGLVKTPIMDDEAMATFSSDLFIPMATVISTTLSLVDGNEMIDARGTCVSGPDVWGRAIEISTKGRYYFCEPQEYSDETVEKLITRSTLRAHV